MPDSRLAQLIMAASIIDERPDIVLGTMAGMIIMQAKRIHDGGQMGIHYVVWHPSLPALPPRTMTPGESALDFIPWITCKVNNDPNNPDSGIFRYEWALREGKFEKIVLSGEYVVKPPAANENGKAQ